MTKKFCPSHSISQEQSIIWLLFMVLMCKMVISPGVFSFFQNFDFFDCQRDKRAKNGPKWQKILSVTCSISQEPYLIWLSFMVHMCKVIISPGDYFIFSKFWFFRLLGGWKCKKWSKMTKNAVCHTSYIRNHTSYDCHLWYTCVKW